MSRLTIMIFLGILTLSSLNLFADDSSGSIQNAASENKHLFIFLYKDQNEKTLRLQNIFDQAMVKMGEQVKSIKIKANDPSEKALIERFNLKRSPMPFVVVLAPNGAITGGFPSFTEEQLMDSVSSPGAAGCLKALQARKLILLCLQNGQTANNKAALKGVNDFKTDPRFANATEIVMIDPSDKKEHKFLNQLSLSTNSPQAVTVLIFSSSRSNRSISRCHDEGSISFRFTKSHLRMLLSRWMLSWREVWFKIRRTYELEYFSLS